MLNALIGRLKKVSGLSLKIEQIAVFFILCGLVLLGIFAVTKGWIR